MSYHVQVAKGSLPCDLGEGPHWNSAKNELLYVDILGKAVFRYTPGTNECYRVGLDTDTVSLICPVENEANKYLIALGRNLGVMEWDGKSEKKSEVKQIYTVDDHSPSNRFNDGKCDSQGKLWAGTMGKLDQATLKLDSKKGSLYSFTGSKCVKKHVDKIDLSNGLTWSPDDRTMYFIDSFAYGVDAFDYNVVDGTIQNRRTVFDLKANGIEGIPDGMTVDSNGNLWIAVFDGGKVINVDPKTGEKIGHIDIPTKKVTSVTFGGPCLEYLYVTTACDFTADGKVTADSAAGALYQVSNLGVKGLSAGYNFKM